MKKVALSSDPFKEEEKVLGETEEQRKRREQSEKDKTKQAAAKVLAAQLKAQEAEARRLEKEAEKVRREEANRGTTKPPEGLKRPTLLGNWGDESTPTTSPRSSVQSEQVVHPTRVGGKRGGRS